MAQVIFDLGSGLSTHNDQYYIRSIMDSIKAADTGKHEVVLKFQLFSDQPPNMPLDQLMFNAAYEYGAKLGYKVTASVFDAPSLKFLLNFEVPFIKIACRPELYWIIGEVPRKLSVYCSVADLGDAVPDGVEVAMLCVPKYPADIAEYRALYDNRLSGAISDHTAGLALFNELKPKIWEKHFVYEREPANPDAGPFALTVEDLESLL